MAVHIDDDEKPFTTWTLRHPNDSTFTDYKDAINHWITIHPITNIIVNYSGLISLIGMVQRRPFPLLRFVLIRDKLKLESRENNHLIRGYYRMFVAGWKSDPTIAMFCENKQFHGRISLLRLARNVNVGPELKTELLTTTTTPFVNESFASYQYGRDESSVAWNWPSDMTHVATPVLFAEGGRRCIGFKEAAANLLARLIRYNPKIVIGLLTNTRRDAVLIGESVKDMCGRGIRITTPEVARAGADCLLVDIEMPIRKVE